jgi:ribonuclease-3
LKFFSNIFLAKKSSKNRLLEEKLKNVLPFTPTNIAFYEEALTHKVNNLRNAAGQKINFERLEFLGDAVIEMIVSEFLFKELPIANEGELTVMRSKIVSRKHLNELGESFKITDLLSHSATAKQLGNNISGNLYEALVGAIFLDKGHPGAKKFIYTNMIDAHINLEKLEKKISSYKSYMIEWAQKNHYDYQFLSKKDYHNGKKNYFRVNFVLNNKKVSNGRSTSKKKAEEIAARRAYYAIQPENHGKNEN